MRFRDGLLIRLDRLDRNNESQSQFIHTHTTSRTMHTHNMFTILKQTKLKNKNSLTKHSQSEQTRHDSYDQNILAMHTVKINHDLVFSMIDRVTSMLYNLPDLDHIA